jgi:GntR family transcriptional regulator
MARVPLYKLAETEMLRRIDEGDWPEGCRLPNEFVLADEFGVSQGTMRRALMTLESMGLLARKPGRGTVVVRPAQPEAPAARPGTISDRCGRPVHFAVFRARATTRGADDSEADLLNSGRLAVLERTLKRAGERAALEEIVASEALLPAFDEDAPADFAACVEAAGLSAARIDGWVTAAVTSMSEAVALSVERHTPLLVVTQVARGADGMALARSVLRIVAKDVAYGACP